MELNGCHVIAAKSTHAVQAAMFVLELQADLPVESIQKLIQYYDSSSSLKDSFPIKAENHGVFISISDGGLGVNKPDGIQGITLQRNDAEGNPEFVFNMQTNRIAFTCNKYTRWQEVSDKAVGLLLDFARFVCPLPGISVIALQYVDEFFVTGKLTEFRPYMLFASGNTKLPVGMLEESNFWHNHSGWFEVLPNKNKVLNNLNISYFPQQSDRNVMQIISAHKEILQVPVTEYTELKENLSNCFELLHSMNKDMFRNILNQETLKSINLN